MNNRTAMKNNHTSSTTSTDERICRIALTLCPGIGLTTAKRLIEAAGSAVQVFARRNELAQLLPDLNASASIRNALDTPGVFQRAEQEMDFATRNGIDCLTPDDVRFPHRLNTCNDAPLYLFFKGQADLNSLRVVSLVGTRHATEYGKQFCSNFVHRLSDLCPDLLVVSGLAYGIDVAAHRAALEHHVPTVAVLAHGLDRIYPYVHRKTAADMLHEGGLLTEFLTGTEPERYNFISRNRIVAGMADAVVVVESGIKGGSLITAALANDYNRECFAVPGRVSDEQSAGCNRLIRDNKAALVQDAEDFVQAMGWSTVAAGQKPVQRQLFQELTAEETLVTQLLARHGDLSINTLTVESSIPVARLSALLFEMEMKGLVKALAGNVYHLLG